MGCIGRSGRRAHDQGDAICICRCRRSQGLCPTPSFCRDKEPDVCSLSQALHSPAAGEDAATDKFSADLLAWLQACRDGTVECVHGFLEGLLSVLGRIVSLFNAPGKEQGPRSDL